MARSCVIIRNFTLGLKTPSIKIFFLKRTKRNYFGWGTVFRDFCTFSLINIRFHMPQVIKIKKDNAVHLPKSSLKVIGVPPLSPRRARKNSWDKWDSSCPSVFLWPCCFFCLAPSPIHLYKSAIPGILAPCLHFSIYHTSLFSTLLNFCSATKKHDPVHCQMMQISNYTAVSKFPHRFSIFSSFLNHSSCLTVSVRLAGPLNVGRKSKRCLTGKG